MSGQIGFHDHGDTTDAASVCVGLAEPAQLACRVCGQKDDGDGFLKIYVQERNVLVLRCRSCGFTWERQALP